MVDNSSTSQTTGEKHLIEHLLTSANNSVRHFRSVYTVYLTVMLYAIVVALSIDQELIFRKGSQQLQLQLPLANISVPVITFFTLIPWFLLTIHFYLLIQATFLSDKVRLYVSELEKSPWQRKADNARKLLFPLPLAHIVAEKESQSKATWILSLIVFISLIVYPLFVLIGIQIKFLLYQSELITWVHRIVITIDILLLWYFWLRIFFPKNENSGKEKLRKRLNVSRAFAASLISIVLFIVVFADFPNNKPYYSYASKFHEWLNVEWIKRIELDGSILVKKEPSPEILAVHYMKKEESDENLMARGSHLWCKYAEPLDLRKRNFREAYLPDVTLCKADLSYADLSDTGLSEANLYRANLYRASLSRANLYRANLYNANLSRADLSDTDLSYANLFRANLSRADLSRANLSTAKLYRANLSRADLSDTDLSYANLYRANLYNADFSKANLSNADLSSTNLWYADFSAASLYNADLSDAGLYNADLSEANLYRADLSEANLPSADLSEANLWYADLSSTNLWYADLSEAKLMNAKLVNTDLWNTNLSAADLSDTDLSGANLSGAIFSNTILTDTNIEYFWVWEGDFPRSIPKSWIKLGYICPEDMNRPGGIDISDYSGEERKIIIEKHCKPYKSQEEP